MNTPEFWRRWEELVRDARLRKVHITKEAEAAARAFVGQRRRLPCLVEACQSDIGGIELEYEAAHYDDTEYVRFDSEGIRVRR